MSREISETDRDNSGRLVSVPNGTIRRNANGYLYIKLNGRWESYARHVMQEHEGRRLKAEERIKYLDGNPENCAIENLHIYIAPPTRKLNHLKSLDIAIRQTKARLQELEEKRERLYDELYPDEEDEGDEPDEAAG